LEALRSLANITMLCYSMQKKRQYHVPNIKIRNNDNPFRKLLCIYWCNFMYSEFPSKFFVI